MQYASPQPPLASHRQVHTEALDTEALDTEALDTEALDTGALDSEARNGGCSRQGARGWLHIENRRLS
jgi:hypothetical protein